MWSADDEADGDADEKQGQARVQLGHVAQRDRDALGDLLARGIAGRGPAPVAAVPAAITSARNARTP